MKFKYLILPIFAISSLGLIASCKGPILSDSSMEGNSSEETSSTEDSSEIVGRTFYLYWNLDGGVTNSEYTHGEIEVGTPIVAPTNVTKEGFSFAGWDKEIPEIMLARNLTITAKWIVGTPINYFDKGGKAFSGTHEDGYPVSYQEKAYLKEASKDGYSFSGWHLDKDCLDEPIYTIDPELFTSGVNLYTDWKRFGGSNVYKAQKLADEDSITIDGYKDEAYNNCTPITINTKASGSPSATATA
ncbi:MAG: InlB B-repeat-containing protein, partial [Bacilli bacterium]|nr:InlB B-repeat-containing protein [Bacilli bacterium]